MIACLIFHVISGLSRSRIAEQPVRRARESSKSRVSTNNMAPALPSLTEAVRSQLQRNLAERISQLLQLSAAHHGSQAGVDRALGGIGAERPFGGLKQF